MTVSVDQPFAFVMPRIRRSEQGTLIDHNLAGMALTNLALDAVRHTFTQDPSQVAAKSRDEAEIEPLYVEGGYEPGRSVSDYYWTLDVWKKKHRFFASVDAYSMEGYQGTTFIEDLITDKAHEAPYRVMRKYKYGGRLP